MTFVVTSAEGKPVDLVGLIYLGTPYSKYVHGLHQAWVDACQLAAKLLQAGLKVYSPIAHTHPLALHGHIDPLDHAIWLPFDEAMMEASHVLLVAEMRGWDQSFGIAHEIAYFKRAKKPVLYLDPDTLEVRKTPSAQIIAFPERAAL